MNFLATLFGEQWKEDSFFLLAGPCAVEGEEMCLEIAERVKGYCLELNIPYAFKASFKKANRSSIDSFTGIGDEKGLEILKKVKFSVLVLIGFDFHSNY